MSGLRTEGDPHVELLRAWTVAGLSSAVLVKAGKVQVLFDCGSMDEKVVDAKYVFITHGHTDHTA